MTSDEEKSKKPVFQRVREKVSEKWKNFSDTTQTIIGIGIILFLGAIACSPIFVFSSDGFFASIPFIYKMLAFLVLSGISLTFFFILTFKYITGLSKKLKTFYGWDDGIAVLLFFYGIFCFTFLQNPNPDPDPNNFITFLYDFRAEMVGTGIATVLIGNATQAAEIQEEKKRLILQMGSPDNGFAVEAVRQLRQQTWLTDGSLKRANFYKANLGEADLGRANLHGATLSMANLNEADLGGANLSKAILLLAILTGARLWFADLSEARLEGADLRGAFLTKTNLSETNLEGADLRGAYLTKANLSGANLEGADLNENTNWEDAFYTEGKNGTVFPYGINPAEHGMHLIHDGESYEEAYKRVFPDK